MGVWKSLVSGTASYDATHLGSGETSYELGFSNSLSACLSTAESDGSTLNGEIGSLSLSGTHSVTDASDWTDEDGSSTVSTDYTTDYDSTSVEGGGVEYQSSSLSDYTDGSYDSAGGDQGTSSDFNDDTVSITASVTDNVTGYYYYHTPYTDGQDNFASSATSSYDGGGTWLSDGSYTATYVEMSQLGESDVNTGTGEDSITEYPTLSWSYNYAVTQEAPLYTSSTYENGAA